VLVAGTSGIVVAAQPADRVILRGLEFDGLGSNSPNDGVNGIRFISGQSLLVDKCIIYGFVNNGIDVVLGAAASVDVKDTVISNIGRAGIRITSTGGGAALAVERVNISRVGANGIEVAGGGLGAVNNSMLFGNGGGVAASVAGAVVNVSNTMFANNNIGANALVAGASIGLDNNAFYGNNTAVNAVGGSQFVSAGNNKFNSNGNDGATPSSSMVIH
jgi:hypothetical protein